jgi:glycosyltransferase involved in cell wall biosynthesis
MINIAFIISRIDRVLAFEWIAQKLDKDKFNPYFILLNPGPSFFEDWLKANGFKVYRITYKGKYSMPWVVIRLFFILAKENITVVHCHLFDAGIAGLLAARLAGVGKRIYTRHYAMMNHVYYPKAVGYDQWINSLATHIVAPSKVVFDTLVQKENVNPKKITLIHHGFDLELFANPDQEIVNKLKQQFNPKNEFPVIGVIARYTHLKGIQYIIPAFVEVLKKYPDALLVLANAEGDYSKEIKEMLSKLPVGSYKEILFEKENAALYQLFNVYVNVPIAKDIDAFGQTYVEALAAGIPSVFTLAGVAREFIIHEKNALVVDFENSDQIRDSIFKLLSDKQLSDSIIAYVKQNVMVMFELDRMMEKLGNMYI